MNGQEASCLAIETIVDEVLPRVREGQRDGALWGELLRHGVERANIVVFQRNQQLTGSSMGTTVTAALIVDQKSSWPTWAIAEPTSIVPDRGSRK